MTTHEEEDKRVVLLHTERCVERRHERLVHRELRGNGVFASAPRHLTARVIRHSPHRHLIQPAAWIRRYTCHGPMRRRCNDRFLHCVLRRGEVAMTSCNDAEHLRRELAQQVQGR